MLFLTPVEMTHVDLLFRDALKHDRDLELKYVEADTGRIYFDKRLPHRAGEAGSL